MSTQDKLAEKPLFDSDIDPKRIKSVADGLRRQGEFESARMLDSYAAMLAAAPQQVTEPVAWRCTWARTKWSQYHDEEDPLPDKWDDDPPDQILPLYTHPQPAQDAKDAARYRKLIATFPIGTLGDYEVSDKESWDKAVDELAAKESGR